MLPLIEQHAPRTAVDIGCNAGWFAAELAHRGIATVGVESHPPYYRTAIYEKRWRNLDCLGVLAMLVDPVTVEVLPEVDCTVFLSTWHHLVQAHGLEVATGLLRSIWKRTRSVMFFETGETEMPPHYRLPAMEPDPRAWLEAFLTEHCDAGHVRHLGTHHGGQPPANRPAHYRNLFAVVRS